MLSPDTAKEGNKFRSQNELPRSLESLGLELCGRLFNGNLPGSGSDCPAPKQGDGWADDTLGGGDGWGVLRYESFGENR